MDEYDKAYDVLRKRLNKMFKMTWPIVSYEFSCFKTAEDGKVIAEFIESKTGDRVIFDIVIVYLAGNNMLQCPLVMPYFCNECLEPVHTLHMFQDKIDEGCTVAIRIDITSDLEKCLFFDKNDTIESLAIEYDLLT